MDPTGLVNLVDLAFGVVDFSLSTSEAVVGVGVMIASPATGPAVPATFVGGTLVATHGLTGMLNSGLAIQNALNDTSGPGLFEGLGGLICEEAGKAGKALDMFSGLRPGALGAGAMSSARDLYDAANTLNSMQGNFGNGP